MRLIDVDKLKISYDGHFVGVAKNDLDNAPTIEAELIIHAHWVESKEGYFSCSNCHNDAMVELYENSQKLTLFCPNCGAQMDEIEPHKDCCDYLDESCNCRLEDGQCNYQPLCNAGDCSMCVK